MTFYFCRSGSTPVCQVPQGLAGSELLEEELESVRWFKANLADDAS